HRKHELHDEPRLQHELQDRMLTDHLAASIEQTRCAATLERRCRQPEVQVRVARRDASARSAHHETLLDQERLDGVLDRAALFAERRCEAVTPTGPPSNFSMIASINRRSIGSKPCGATSGRASAACATGALTRPTRRTP